jgi:hypothetical protein
MSHPRRRGRALNELTTTRDIIAALDGNQAVAALTGRKTQHVTNWKKDGFPADTFLILTDALAKLGYRASPKLWGIDPVEQE